MQSTFSFRAACTITGGDWGASGYYNGVLSVSLTLTPKPKQVQVAVPPRIKEYDAWLPVIGCGRGYIGSCT
jgi:hypothetical protein